MNYQTLLIIAWESRHFLLKICGVGLLLGLIVAFSTPNEYETSIFTVPESTSIATSGEESLDFETIGKNIGSNQKIQDAILPSFYPQVINSTPFLVSLFDTPVILANHPETNTISLFEYMSEHQRSPWWNSVISLPFKTLGFITGFFREEETPDEETSDNHSPDIFQLTQYEAAVASAISRRITVGVDRTKRTITLTVRMQDPLVATTVADSVRAHLQAYITNYRTKKERENFTYTEKVYQQVREEYYTAQKNYAHFVDNNRSLSNKSAQSKLAQLKIDMDLAYRDYVKITQQLQLTKSRLSKQRPVYAIIEPAKVSPRPVAPQKGKILVGFIILSAIAGCGWIVLKSKIKFTQ